MFKINTHFIIFASIFFTFAGKTLKAEQNDTFKCTKLGHVNFRNGPGTQFPIISKVMKKGYPLKIVDFVDSWLAVEDFKGEKMWVSTGNMSSKCGKIVKSKEAKTFLEPQITAPSIITLEEGFILSEIKCYEKWCETKIEGKKVWILKEHLWG